MTSGINRGQLDRLLQPLSSVLQDDTVDTICIVAGAGVSIGRGTLCEQIEIQIDIDVLSQIATLCLGDAPQQGPQTATVQVDENLELRVLRAGASAKQVHVLLQKPVVQNLSLQDVIDWDLLPSLAASVLDAALQARMNLVLGGSRHGEAPLLARALLNALPRHERLLQLVYREAEVLSHPGVLPVALTGETPSRAVADQALDMRPDRLVVLRPKAGEIRWWLDHAPSIPGSLLCVPACNSAAVLNRLQTAGEPIEAPDKGHSPPASRRSVGGAAQLLVCLGPVFSGQSRLEEIVWVEHRLGHDHLVPVFTRQLIASGPGTAAELRATPALLDVMAHIQARGVCPDADLLQIAVQDHRPAPDKDKSPSIAPPPPPPSRILPGLSTDVRPRTPPRIDSGHASPYQPPPTEVDHPVPLPEMPPGQIKSSTSMQTIDHDDPGWELEILARGMAGSPPTSPVIGPDVATTSAAWSAGPATGAGPLRHDLDTGDADSGFDALVAAKRQRNAVEAPAIAADDSLLGSVETAYLHLEPPPMPAPLRPTDLEGEPEAYAPTEDKKVDS